MTDQTGGEGTQAEPTTQPQAGATQQAQAASAEPETISLEEARKLRAEARSLRDRLKVIEERDVPEAERSKRRLEELERSNEGLVRELQQERIQSRVLAAATRLGFADPADAYSLLPDDALEVADGVPRNVDQALKRLLEKKPYLASSTVRATGSAEGGARGAPAGEPNMNQLIRRAAGRA